MKEIFWLSSAKLDLIRLKDFLKLKNPMASRRAADSIKNSVNKLSEFPHMGVRVYSLRDYYDLSVEFGDSGYVIRYRVFNDAIYIVKIKHKKEQNFL